MKIAAIIYSRLSSKRLKNKALIKINDNILLDLIIKRAKLIKNLDEIIVATSSEAEDQKIVKLAKKNSVKFFCGSLENLIDRSINCCKKFEIDAFVRICGDRPLFDIDLIEKGINIYRKERKNSIDLVSSEIQFKSIPGLVTEIISFNALQKIKKQKLSKFNLDHITSYFYENYDLFNIKKLLSKYKFNGIKLTIDYKEDKDRISYIFNSNYPKYYLDTDLNILKAKEWYLNQQK
tara:strand:+ start:207 stop:911 length:705 start_codon:yes stop_codon:yes gene_type:complete